MGKENKQSSELTVPKDNKRRWGEQVYPYRMIFTGFIIRYLPIPVRLFFKRIGMQGIFDKIMVKPEAELLYQTAAVGIIKNCRNKVEDYWKKYRLLDEVKKLCIFKRNTKVLDVGCGIVTVLHFIKGRKYGLDPLAKQLIKIYKYPADTKVVEGVAEEIPFPDEYFDVVFCTNVLDHIEDPERAVNEVVRVLKDGGYFVFSVHIEVNRGKIVHLVPGHTFNFNEKEALDIISKHFRVLRKKRTLETDLHSYVYDFKAENNELTLILKKK